MKVLCKFLILLILFTATRVVFAGQEKLCFSCHDKKIFSKVVIHQPVANGECDLCHNPHVARIKGLLKNDVKKLCASCHVKIGIIEKQSTIIHKPVLDGQCTVCHDPHSSSASGLLIQSNQKEGCLKCHEDLAKSTLYTHQPFAKGLCTACHQPHQSERPYLLNAQADVLCHSCHKGSLVEFHKNFPVIPAACLSCHNPHGSSRKGLIKDYLHEPFTSGCTDCHNAGGKRVSTEKCFECHDEIKEKSMSVYNHMNNNSGNGCTNCHSPHASDGRKLIKTKLDQVCRVCHSDTFKNFEDKLHKHPNVMQCSNCHEVHGSNFIAMLKVDANQVCNGCHKSQGQFTHPVGEGVFDPRTGVVMNCVSCHYPHGTDHPFNLKLEGSKELCVQCHRGY